MAAEDNTSEERGGLPEKEWYTLDEIADRWGWSVADLVHYGETGKIAICFTTLHEGGALDVWAGRRYTEVPLSTNDLLQLLPESVGAIASAYRNSSCQINFFRPRKDGEAITAPLKVRFKSVPRKGLVITRAERDRFEQEHKLGPHAERCNAQDPRPVMGNRERDTFLRIIAALMVDGYGWDGREPYSKAKEIVDDVALKGFDLSDRTLGGKLKQAAEFIPPEAQRK